MLFVSAAAIGDTVTGVVGDITCAGRSTYRYGFANGMLRGDKAAVVADSDDDDDDDGGDDGVVAGSGGGGGDGKDGNATRGDNRVDTDE